MSKTCFLWDPIEDNIVKEFDVAGNELAMYTAEPNEYGHLLSQSRAAASSYLHYDALGSTIALTGGAQQTSDTIAYSAFGLTTETSIPTALSFRYIGRHGYYFDGHEHLYAVRRRSFDETLIRWLSFDPLGGEYDAPNPYSYTHNRPVHFVDPAGLQAKTYLPGTAVCGGKPAGPVYIGGRGKFRSATVSSYVSDSIWESPFPRVGSDFRATWSPNSTAFIDAKGCCCCDKVGFVQIVAWDRGDYHWVTWRPGVASRGGFRRILNLTVAFGILIQAPLIRATTA